MVQRLLRNSGPVLLVHVRISILLKGAEMIKVGPHGRTMAPRPSKRDEDEENMFIFSNSMRRRSAFECTQISYGGIRW